MATSMLMTYVGDNFDCFSHQLYLEVLASGTNIPTNNIGDNFEILSPIPRNYYLHYVNKNDWIIQNVQSDTLLWLG